MKHLIGWNFGYQMIDIDAPVKGQDGVYLRDILPANDPGPDEIADMHERFYNLSPDAYNLLRVIVEQGPETNKEIWRKKGNRVSMTGLKRFARRKWGWGKEKLKDALAEVKGCLTGETVQARPQINFKRRARA